MLTLNFLSHTFGPAVQEEIRKRLLRLMGFDSTLNATEFTVSIMDEARRKEPGLTLSAVAQDAVRVHVPLLNGSDGRRGYRSFEATIKVPSSISIGSFSEAVRRCLVKMSAPGDVSVSTGGQEKSPAVQVPQTDVSDVGQVVGDTKPTARGGEMSPLDLARVLVKVYHQNTVAKKPKAVTKIVVEVTGDARVQSSIHKTVNDLKDQGYLSLLGKVGTLVRYMPTQKAIDLIKRELGEDVGLDDVPSPATLKEVPALPEMTFDDALAKFLEQKQSLETLVASAPGLREEITKDEIALSAKRARLKAIEEAESKLHKMTRQFANLLR